MEHDLEWYIRKIKEGDQEAEMAFRKEYFYPFSEIIRHYTFAVGHISDLMGFTKVVMDDFIWHIKCGNPVNERAPQKTMEKFVMDRTGIFISDQLRALFVAINNQDEGAEDRLRKDYTYIILLYFDKHPYYPDNYNHVTLADKIMDEWVRLAKRDGGGGVQNFVAFLTNNINKRIIDELKTQKRGKESCLRKRVPKDSRLPGSTRDFLKMETLRGIIKRS